MPDGEACRILAVERHFTAVIKAMVPLNGIGAAQRSLRKKIHATIPLADIGNPGRSLTLWRPPVAGIMDLEAGILVSQGFAPVGELVPSTLPNGRAACFRLIGGYEGLPGAWRSLFDWCGQTGLTLAGVNWEIYESDDPAKPETSLYALIAEAA